MILSQKVANGFLRRKKKCYNSGKGKNLMIIPSKLSSSFIPIYETKNTKSNLRNDLKRRGESKKWRCLCSYSTSSQFSANTIYLIKQNLSIFIKFSFQLFKTLSLSQHLANPGFIAPVKSGIAILMWLIRKESFRQ